VNLQLGNCCFGRELGNIIVETLSTLFLSTYDKFMDKSITVIIADMIPISKNFKFFIIKFNDVVL
jgi:hypothetical protein